VLNAAFQKKATVRETDLDLMRKTFEVNVFGNYRLAALFADACKKKGQPGAIVVHSSNQSEFVNPTGFAYSLSKAALNQMVKHLAMAYVKDMVRVNGILLGWFDTEGERKFYSKEQIARQAALTVPSGRAGRPEEAAELTYFLGSERSSYCTGGLLRCDGGFALSPDLSS
jgi:NAD(P)-dependent dehydrogenase (short-subunit alcohol dehydrogenase family)